MKRYATVLKNIGETPLEALLRLRSKLNIDSTIPLAYAGRLDPMASGKLLILIGDECKKQSSYHSLDKEYEFSVLFGIQSDTADILGIQSACTSSAINEKEIENATQKLVGEIEFPYPNFSSKAVNGKPLHIWTLENKLDQIQIPTKKSKVHTLRLLTIEKLPIEDIYESVLKKIEKVTPVTEESKKLGRDFRRTEVLDSWNTIQTENESVEFVIASFTCIASSGTYMRTLAEEIAKGLGTCGLAYAIHRKKIGKYLHIGKSLGLWIKQY